MKDEKKKATSGTKKAAAQKSKNWCVLLFSLHLFVTTLILFCVLACSQGQDPQDSPGPQSRPAEAMSAIPNAGCWLPNCRATKGGLVIPIRGHFRIGSAVAL